MNNSLSVQSRVWFFGKMVLLGMAVAAGLSLTTGTVSARPPTLMMWLLILPIPGTVQGMG